MSITQTLEGTIRPDGTLELVGRLDLPPGQVRVIVEMLAPRREPTNDILSALQEIKKAQLARGYAGRTDEEMRADEEASKADDREYQARWEEIYRRIDSTQGEGEPQGSC